MFMRVAFGVLGMSPRPLVGLALGLLLTLPSAAVGAPITITFDALADLEGVTTQYPGLTFTNTTALQAGYSLDEFEFPPYSGQVIVMDDGGAITITFGQAVAAVGGYFTYGVPVTLTAYDAAHVALGSITSTFSENYLSSGNAPNEFLGLASTGIVSVTIAGGLAGTSFVLDDLTYDPGAVSVPEASSSLLLLTMGLASLFARRRRR